MAIKLLRVTIGILMTSLAGCAAVGAIAYVATPPPHDPAEYKLDKTPTVVLAENFQNPSEFEVYAERLERLITDQLTESKAGKLIEAEKVDELKNGDKQSFQKMNIPGVGRALGAGRVIYIDLVQFSINLPIGGQTLAGRAEAHVKVVEVATGKTLWPLDSSTGRMIKAETKYEQDANGNTPAGIEDQLSQKLSDQIARLFYDSPTERIDGADRDYDQKM